MKISGLGVRGESISCFLRCSGFLLSVSITLYSFQITLLPLPKSLPRDVSSCRQEGYREVEPEYHEKMAEGRRCNDHGLTSSRLDLTAPTAYQGPRTLLKEGTVTKSKSGRKLTMVLCNDIIVLVESRNLYRMVRLYLLL